MPDRDELTSRQSRILQFIKSAVSDRGYPPSIREIGEVVGLTSTSSVHSQLSALERKGYIRRDPTKPRAIEIFDEPPVEQPRPLPVYVPLLGQIAAGQPILADENVDELLPLPRDLVGQGELFGLHVRGDSMIEAGVLDGDFVIVRSQPTADNGDMVAALLEDLEAEATVKYFHRNGGKVELRPANPNYQPIDGTRATILGKVVTVLRNL
jgi:repressor LexA